MTTEAARDRALSVLRHAAERAPGNAALWARYVYELRVAGLKARARKAAGAARVAAGQRKMLQDIAEGRSGPVEDIAGMIERGDLAGAWAAGSERLRYFPKDHRLLNLLGVAALSDGDPVRAEPVLRRAVEVEPGNEAARGNLGLALVRQKRAVEAIAVLEEAGSRPGALPAIRVNLASAYQTLRRWEEAERLSAALIREMPGDGEVVAVRCKVLIALGRASEALGLLEPLRGIEGFALHDLVAEALGEVEGPEAGLDYLRDLPMQPREAEVRLVSLMAEWGDLEGAAARARALAESLPDDPDPFWLVGLFSTWKAGDPLIDVMRKGLAAPALAPERRGIFGLALAKALMDVGEDGAAMAALDDGNGLLRLLLDYDVADDEARMEKIAAHWTESSLRDRTTERSAPAPIFIVGLPRSGSTLFETILSRHPEVDSLGEDPRVFDRASRARLAPDRATVAELAGTLAPMLAPGPGKRVTTDKLLANFLNIGVLAACFPQARFVEMRRDYRATGLSIYQSVLGLAAHPYATDLEDLARYIVAYDRLMAHWARVVGRRLLRLDYAALVSSPEAELPRALDGLGLDWHPDCLHPEGSERRINTLSVGQARKPISTGSIARWTRFEDGLQPLTARLEAAGLV